MTEFRETVSARLLPDGKRLHLAHGPIDLVVEAFGDQVHIERAYQAAVKRFGSILDELVADLRVLRSPAPLSPDRVGSAVARSMIHAANLHGNDTFITPMACVAGAVADEILAVMLAAARLEKAYVNNGGDIALHVMNGQTLRTGVAVMAEDLKGGGVVEISGDDGIGGIATSGRHGRSHSLGIADSVTVIASTTREADAAATLIANAVDISGHGKIKRAPASSLSPDSDLGDRLVVIDVDELTTEEIHLALDHGGTIAQQMVRDDLILACRIYLCDQAIEVGDWTRDYKNNEALQVLQHA